MLIRLRKTTKQTAILLLMGIMINLPISNSILCIETDGTSSIENAPLGSCLATKLSTHETDRSISNASTSDDHKECIDCTDVSLSQTVSTKLQSEIDHSIVPDTFYVADISYEVPVYTEPIESFTPNLAFVPNQLHKHLQTIIFLI